MAGPIKVTAFVTKKGVVHRATTRFKVQSSPRNGGGVSSVTVSRRSDPYSRRSLSVVTRPSGSYARGHGPGRGALGNTYHVTPSSARRFFALAARSR